MQLLENDSTPKPRPPQLAYAPTSGGPTRRQFRLLLILTMVNTVLLGGYILGPRLWSYASEQWTSFQNQRAAERKRKQAEAARLAMLPAQEKCLKFVAPADRLVYAQDPDGGARILAQSSPTTAKRQPVLLPAVAPPPDCLVQLPKVIEGWGELSNARWAYAFVHERRASPSDPPRLVVVLLYGVTERPASNRPVREQITVVALTLRPASLSEDLVAEAYSSYGATRADEAKQNDDTFLRVGSGQPDPDDPSRFSIPYELTGVGKGTFDGQLLGNELVTLTSNGPVTLFEGTHRP
jgi:hypothetical protein